MNPADKFKSWLHSNNARPHTYHEGFLMRDRAEDPFAAETARAAWLAHVTGRVELCQRKVEAGRWQYIAQKRKRRRV